MQGSGNNIRPRLISLSQGKGILIWGNEHTQSIQYSMWNNDQLGRKLTTGKPTNEIQLENVKPGIYFLNSVYRPFGSIKLLLY
ncbi:MAG: hypothetical protein IPM34_12930 [Saprospiraceae bacterium]|nr:hypothetical protein [Saprospiraceae bacterium]